eukprot:scaffold4489_cov165-Amphora_coffeaeformis.AAC.8
MTESCGYLDDASCRNYHLKALPKPQDCFKCGLTTWSYEPARPDINERDRQVIFVSSLDLNIRFESNRTWQEPKAITSPGHETPLASGVSTNVSVDVDTHQYDSEADVDANHHDPGQDQDQPAFNRLWNNQYAVLTELDM